MFFFQTTDLLEWVVKNKIETSNYSRHNYQKEIATIQVVLNFVG